MGVEEFLSSGENLRYTSPSPVNLYGTSFTMLITNKRIIWHRTKGFLVKKNNFYDVSIDQIKDIKYEEKGLISKLAFINIFLLDKRYEFSGERESMKAVYRELHDAQDSVNGKEN